MHTNHWRRETGRSSTEPERSLSTPGTAPKSYRVSGGGSGVKLWLLKIQRGASSCGPESAPPALLLELPLALPPRPPRKFGCAGWDDEPPPPPPRPRPPPRPPRPPPWPLRPPPPMTPPSSTSTFSDGGRPAAPAPLLLLLPAAPLVDDAAPPPLSPSPDASSRPRLRFPPEAFPPPAPLSGTPATVGPGSPSGPRWPALAAAANAAASSSEPASACECNCLSSLCSFACRFSDRGEVGRGLSRGGSLEEPPCLRRVGPDSPVLFTIQGAAAQRRRCRRDKARARCNRAPGQSRASKGQGPVRESAESVVSDVYTWLTPGSKNDKFPICDDDRPGTPRYNHRYRRNRAG